jgi:hypothetical protein
MLAAKIRKTAYHFGERARILGHETVRDVVIGLDCQKDGSCTGVFLALPQPGGRLSALDVVSILGARVMDRSNDVSLLPGNGENIVSIGWGFYRVDVDFETGRIALRFTRDDTQEVGEATCEKLFSEPKALSAGSP